MSLKRLISFMALASVSVFGVGAPAAHAQAADDTMATAACTLLPGVAGTAVGGDGVNAIVGNDLGIGGGWDPENLLDTDPGYFDFDGTALCTGLDVASEQGKAPIGGPTAIPPTVVNIEAAGDYDNLTCGTGTANGDARLFLFTPDLDIQIYAEFGITFVEGTGALSLTVDADFNGTSNGGGQDDSDRTGPEALGGNGDSFVDGDNVFTAAGVPGAGPRYSNQIDGGNGAGVINIRPTIGNCITTNVAEFSVNGAFESSLSGEGATVTDGTAPINDSDA